MSDTKRKEG